MAFRKALSARIIAGDVSVIDTFAVTELKTKAFIKLVGDSVQDAKKVLIVGDQFDETTYKAGRNVKAVQMTTADGVNTEDLSALQQDPHHQRRVEPHRRAHRRS